VTTPKPKPQTPNSKSLKILLVEDDELFRLGLRVRLQQEPEIDILSEAEDGETAIEWIKQHPFDLVLLDIGLPGIGGIETCHQIKKQYPNIPVLVLTSRTDRTLIARLIDAGVQGYCLKGIAAETLMLAIRSIVAGASWWDAAAISEIRTAFQDRETKEPKSNFVTHPLTPRELEILALISTGKTNSQIAEILYISPGTVRVHVHAILHKLDVRDRQEAITMAIQQHLIPSELDQD
jgi:two-component system, NarL family, response regulator